MIGRWFAGSSDPDDADTIQTVAIQSPPAQESRR